MKSINRYITEKLRISKGTSHTLFPKSRADLINIIIEETKKNGNRCSLNHVDTSNIGTMSYLFGDSNKNFNGDISEWDVSNVTNMCGLFWYSDFNGDISGWDVSKVENMSGMFSNSSFNNNSICNWDVSNILNMRNVFANSPFNQDISGWNINSDADISNIFYSCPIKNEYKPYQNNKRIK